MQRSSSKIVRVLFCRGQHVITMGRLALKDSVIFFEYDPSFLALGLELSPLKLPLKQGVIVCEERTFDGLFGIFNDSLPDGWGRLLLDRKLMQLGINPLGLTPLDRLSYVGGRGMGALRYEPEIEKSVTTDPKTNDLDVIAEECFQVQEQDADQYIDDLLAMNGSSAGARPKILINLHNSAFDISTNDFKQKHNDWIIKFASSIDPKDIGSIEYAYHLMAQDAGLDVPEAKLFKSKKCSGYFGVKRFDRKENQFLHMHTLSGLLHVDHRVPSFDYEMLLKVTSWLTKDARQLEQQFRHAVFNVYSHNRDDHTKNFSFLMDEKGRWTVSPAYDLTFSSGPGGEHCTMVMGEGKNPGSLHLLKLADSLSIKHDKAKRIIEEVQQSISKWAYFAKRAHVSSKSANWIQKSLNQLLKQ